MELRHLRYFVAVAEEENVSRAALKLHVSQPGVSRQIRDLEAEIGFQLFKRGAKSLRLTEAGKTFLTEAKAVLQHADDAVKKARASVDGARGEIHVGYAPSLSVQILPLALRRFQADFPEVRVALHDLSTEEMVTQLGEGKLHVALMAKPGRKMLRGLEFRELARYSVCVAVAPKHPLAKSKAVYLARLIHEPLIAFSRRGYPEFLDSVHRIFANIGGKLRVAEEHDDINSVLAAVESGSGFALVPNSLALTVGKRLKILALSPALPPVAVGVSWLKASSAHLVKHFVAATSPAP